MTNPQSDWADAKTEELVPCIYSNAGFSDCLRGLSFMCSACVSRPAVAAALRQERSARNEEIEQLKTMSMALKAGLKLIDFMIDARLIDPRGLVDSTKREMCAALNLL